MVGQVSGDGAEQPTGGDASQATSNYVRELNTAHDFRAKHLIRDLLDFVYPPVCQVCRKSFEREDDNIWLCASCHSTLSVLPQPHCAICRSFLPDPKSHCSNCHRVSPLLWVYSLGIYDDHFSHLIKAYKYESKIGLGKMLGRMLGTKLLAMPHINAIDLVCSVPMHHRKERSRGFDQTAIIVKEIADVVGTTYRPHLLMQLRPNQDQIGLTVEGRYRNVRGVFEVASDAAAMVKGRRILLVDDVTTSGATLNSAAVTLISSGAACVAAATLAMALEDGLEPCALYALMSEEF